MEDCWNEVPNYRPRLDLLVQSLGEMFGERSATSVSLTDVKVYKVHKFIHMRWYCCLSENSSEHPT
jgi:hypothetical protein